MLVTFSLFVFASGYFEFRFYGHGLQGHGNGAGARLHMCVSGREWRAGMAFR